MASPAFSRWLRIGAFAVVFVLAHLVLVARLILTWPAHSVRFVFERPLFRLLEKLSS